MTLKLLAWDIENSAATGRHWSLFNQNIGLVQLVNPGQILSFAARWHGSPRSSIQFSSVYHNTQVEMLENAWDLLDEADALISWNGAGFDTKKMNWEFKLHNIRGGLPYSPVKEIDLMREHKKVFRTISNKLDFVSAQLLGKTKVSHEGFKLWLAAESGDPKAWAKFKRYNEQDVHLLIDLYDEMLPWLKLHPNRNLYDIKTEGCPRCPAGPEAMAKDGFHPTTTGMYQRYRCRECGYRPVSGKRVFGADIR